MPYNVIYHYITFFFIFFRKLCPFRAKLSFSRAVEGRKKAYALLSSRSGSGIFFGPEIKHLLRATKRRGQALVFHLFNVKDAVFSLPLPAGHENPDGRC